MGGFLRHLTNSHSVSGLLAITVGVGCFLLLLNILIFAGIYYQRVKRTLDTKKKEEFVEADIILPNFIDHCIEKNMGKDSFSVPSYSANTSYENYNRYVDIRKGSICASVENHKCKSIGNDSHFVRIPIHSNDLPEKLLHVSMDDASHLSTYPSPQLKPSLSKGGSIRDLPTYQSGKELNGTQKPHTEHCNQSTQSDFLPMHDVGTTAMESDVEDRHKKDESGSEKVHSTPSSLRSSISTSNYQGGILRQQLGPTTPSTSKKRVQIQEISV